MKATKVESFVWARSTRLRGFVIDSDIHGRLPGLFVLDMDAVDVSIERELTRWNRGYTYTLADHSKPPIEYETSLTKVKAYRPDRTSAIHSGTMLAPHDTPVDDATIDEMRKALKEAI